MVLTSRYFDHLNRMYPTQINTSIFFMNWMIIIHSLTMNQTNNTWTVSQKWNLVTPHNISNCKMPTKRTNTIHLSIYFLFWIVILSHKCSTIENSVKKLHFRKYYKLWEFYVWTPYFEQCGAVNNPFIT